MQVNHDLDVELDVERDKHSSEIVAIHPLTCGNAFSGPLGVVDDRWSRPDFLRTVCGLPGHGDSPRARAASNSVRATCSAFSVAAAPTGLAS
jgi:hypothetical protein